MRNLSVWVVEFIKLLGRRRLHPLNAECPICHQMVRLHYNNAGRRHLLAHARACSRALYEGSRYRAHYTANIKCRVQAPLRGSILDRMKISTLKRRNPLSSKADE